MSSGIKKILVVEDTSVTRFSVKRLLEEHGYEVAEAASGEEALTRLAAHPEPFDLIILDIFLPGMDGLAVLRELKARPRSQYTPVMVFTASSSVSIVRQALDLGAVEFLVKPFAPQELIRRVQRLIGPGRRQGEGPLEALFGVLRLEVNRAARSKGVFSLVVGRRLGPGSRSITELEGYVKRRLRDIDTVMGLDTGSLAVVLPVTGTRGAEVVKGKLADWLGALEAEAKWDFGVATYPDNGTDPASLYGHAQAMLRAHEPLEDRQPAPAAQPAGTCSPDKPGEERGQAKGNGNE